MFFDQMRSGGCSQVLSVAPEYRNYGKSHPGRDDDCREHGNRPGRDDDCREHGNRPGRDNDCREHGNGGSNCGKGCNAEEDCCKSGVTAILEIAIQALSRDETVGVEITLEGGYTQVVTLGRGTQTFVSSDLLSTPLGVVSLCEVTRLRILSDSAADPDYMQRLSDALERFAGGNRRRSEGGCSEDGCDSCVEAIQRYIMRNADDIEALLYDGSQAATASAVTGTTTAEALSSASISSTEGSFLTSAVLETETAGAVTSVTTADTGLVTAVEASPATVVTAVTAAAAEVSAPVTFTPVEVLGEVTVTDEAEFVSGLTVTPASVSGALTTETLTVVSGFTAPVTVSGVISGVTAVSAVTTSATDVPVLVGTGTGPLQVVVPANAFGAGIPETAVTLPVTVGGATLTFGGNITAYTFASASTLLGDVAGAPVVTDISTPGVPETADVLSAVTAEEVAVAGEVAFDTAPGSLLTGSTPVTVNSIDAAETVEVVGDITPEFADISGLGEVQSTAATDIFTVETAPVLTSVELITETGEALISAEIATETETVLTGLESSPVNVVSPTAAEPVDGDIIAARRGIIAVENTDGDISVYTSCAVRGAQLDTTPAPGM